MGLRWFGLRALGLRVRFLGSYGLRVSGLGFRDVGGVWDPKAIGFLSSGPGASGDLRVRGLGFQDLGFRVEGLGFRASGFFLRHVLTSTIIITSITSALPLRP